MDFLYWLAILFCLVQSALFSGLTLGLFGLNRLELEIADFTGGLGQLFIIGLLTSAIVGYIVIAFFLRYLARHSLDVFAYYRMVLAGLVVVWLLV